MIGCRESLPRYYDNNIIGFFPQSPDTLFVYWELSFSYWETVRGMGGAFVRLYSVRESGNFAIEYNLVREVQQPPFTENWYFEDLEPETVYCVEIGGKLPDGSFFPLIKSERAMTPPVPRFDTLPRLKPAPDLMSDKVAGNKVLEIPGNKAEFSIGVFEIFQEMPFYMGYNIQLAG